jgi:molecular chaperone GrpE
MSDPIQPTAAPAAAPESDIYAPPVPAGAALSDEQTADQAAADLNTQLQAAFAESLQIKDALLRALADSENIRKRAQTDIANAYKFAIEGFAMNLLPVKDTLEMALSDDASSTEQIKLGVDLTLKNLAAAFDKAKVVEVNPLNQKFDPNRHQAVSQIESDQPANTVVQVFQKGYLLQDRVLRPAMVAVARAKGAATAQGEKPVESKG